MKESGPGHRDLIPAIPSLILQTGGSEGGALPLTVKEGRKWLQREKIYRSCLSLIPQDGLLPFSPRQPLLSLDGLTSGMGGNSAETNHFSYFYRGMCGDLRRQWLR